MVSQRQRMARKRFREANQHLFPKPEHPKTPSLKKETKKENLKKRIALKSAKIGMKSGTFKTKTKKHPLRVDGKRPGEGCFICKSKDHIAKFCPEKVNWERNKICLLCRHHGHSLKNCPLKKEIAEQKICYNCGEANHSLSRCPLPIQDGGAKFANCFVCNELGHLSKDCPVNAHGIYPKGGSCNICGDLTHLAKHCPQKAGSQPPTFVADRIALSKKDQQAKSNITVRSGDDLEDDFVEEDIRKKTSAGGFQVKPKRKQCPKLVNFIG
ncbi:hypothetical protein HPP92_006518 [Vanilla planifolia]|uniref:CCHC-type domain-containing protein n=2 Tax=Vanilla planifolia TaxID=51239 RepID=A0A835VDN4_VANPL|nr:hypothetical protein HPP92_006518 [Vanilla planifolia]